MSSHGGLGGLFHSHYHIPSLNTTSTAEYLKLTGLSSFDPQGWTRRWKNSDLHVLSELPETTPSRTDGDDADDDADDDAGADDTADNNTINALNTDNTTNVNHWHGTNISRLVLSSLTMIHILT